MLIITTNITSIIVILVIKSDILTVLKSKLVFIIMKTYRQCSVLHMVKNKDVLISPTLLARTQSTYCAFWGLIKRLRLNINYTTVISSFPRFCHY